MPLTTAGLTLMTQLLLGETVADLAESTAHLGVGDDNAAFAAGQTDLQAAVNKLRKVMVNTYPQRVGLEVTFQSAFGPAEANFAWEEVGVFNAASSGTMVGRKVQALGTKAGGTWTLTATVTFALCA